MAAVLRRTLVRSVFHGIIPPFVGFTFSFFPIFAAVKRYGASFARHYNSLPLFSLLTLSLLLPKAELLTFTS
jgi:hypothetical protein